MKPSEAARALSHDQLMNLLADSLIAERRMVWRDIQLGPAGSPRPDVYTIDKSFVNPNPTAYEVKVSRSDFLADATAGKWHSYLKYAGAVVFACEVGLLKPTEIPEMAGLIVRHPSGGWRYAKRPIRQPVDIPTSAWLKLLIDGAQREGPIVRRRAYNDVAYLKKVNAKFGEAVARAARNYTEIESQINQAHEAAKRIVSHANEQAKQITQVAESDRVKLMAEITEALEISPDTSSWEIRSAVRKLRSGREDLVQTRVRQLLQQAVTLIDRTEA